MSIRVMSLVWDNFNRGCSKIGIELVEWLEGHHEPKHYTVDDLKAIKAEYTRKEKELEKANG